MGCMLAILGAVVIAILMLSPPLWALVRGITDSQWTVLAALAQMGAGVLALATIWQAARQIRLSVAPDWDFDHCGHVSTHGQPYVARDIYFVNTGFGPARRPMVRFEPSSPPALHSYRSQGTRVVLPNATFWVHVRWLREEQLDTDLILIGDSRLGGRSTAKFHLRAWTRGAGVECEVTRL